MYRSGTHRSALQRLLVVVSDRSGLLVGLMGKVLKREPYRTLLSDDAALQNIARAAEAMGRT